MNELKAGEVAQLELRAFDSPGGGGPVPLNSSVENGLMWAVRCFADPVDYDNLADLDGLLEQCHSGIFSLSVDLSEDSLAGWTYQAGVWQLNGFFVVESDNCVTGSCGATLRRITPEVAAQLAG
jgi:hypothetical protein